MRLFAQAALIFITLKKGSDCKGTRQVQARRKANAYCSSIRTQAQVQDWAESGMEWRQFYMQLESLDTERVEQALMANGALAISLTDAGDDPILEPAPGDTPLWTDTRVCALFAADTDFRRLRRELCHELEIESLPDNYVETLADRAWEREWMKDFRPMRFGRRLWVCPTDMQVDATDALVIKLDPGLAFGTGTHPTTALCLTWIEKHDFCDRRALDLGCGSGILTIAALKLGAAHVDAIDIDLQALAATRQNADRNGVGDRVQTDVEVHSANGLYDVVIANILAGTLTDLADRIVGALKPGGSLVLSGILTEQAASVAGVYRDFIKFDAPAHLEGWTRLSGTRH